MFNKNGWLRPSIAAVGIALSVSANAGITNNTFAGRTPGVFSVDPHTGAATYTIPIQVPPGPRDMEPKLSFSYNSQHGNGYMGVGWSLTGLSAITRCARTYAQDGVPGSVSLTYSDRFCLDGVRLRLTSSENLATYGQDGTTYQTEIANFSHITAHGVTGNGPAYFTVQGADGLTYEYGTPSYTQIPASGTSTVLTWLLSTVSDRYGNSVKYNYYPGTGSVAPYMIQWTLTGYGSSSYTFAVYFKYLPTANVPQGSFVGYIGGTPVANTSLLTSVQVGPLFGAIIKDYELTYTYSATTGRPLLAVVDECSGVATNCLHTGTWFSYQKDGLPGVSASATSALSTAAPGSSFYAQYDFRGDGATDLAYYQGGVWYVSLQTSSGYGTPINTGITDAKALFGDVQGTGQDGILARNGSTFYFYSYNDTASGGTFVGTPTSTTVDAAATQYVLADVTGDGLPDLVILHFTFSAGNNSHILVYTLANTSAGGTVSFAAPVTAYTEVGGSSASLVANSRRNDGKLKFMDFDGDGRADLLLTLSTGASTIVTELLSEGLTFKAGATFSGSASAGTAIFPVSWNDDACTDLYFAGYVHVSGCNGSNPASYAISGTVVGAMDWDGDGRTDLLVVNGSTLGVYVSWGNAVAPLESTSIPYSANHYYFTFDANGDGQDDLGYINTAASGYPVEYFGHNNRGAAPDLLVTTYDNNENTYTVTHTPLLWSDYYNDLIPAAGYKPYYSSRYVVTSVLTPDPSTTGGSFTQTFSYRNAWQNLQGRGFSGFGAIYVKDSRKNEMRLMEYGSAFPYTAIPLGNLLFQDATFNYPIRDQELTFGLTALDSTAGNQRYFPYISNDTTYEYEVGGAKNAQLVNTSSTNYTYDNWGNQTNRATAITDNDFYANQVWTKTIASTFTPDTGANWCLHLPTRVQVTGAAPGTPSVTRIVNYTPDYAKCHQTTIITEPGNAEYQVTESFAFDNFGNIATDTVTGAGMGVASPATRTTSTNWGTTGVLPMQVRDPSGGITTFNYDFNWGVPTSLTDVNNVPTTWQYGDGFGRVTKEIRADGTSTTWTYTDCSTSNSCVVNYFGTTITETVYNANGTVQSTDATYYDTVDRPLVAQSQGFASGTFNRDEVRYDSFGNVSQQAFPCVWFDSKTPCTNWKTIAHDLRNRPNQITQPVDQGNDGSMTTKIAYAGDSVTTTDPLNNATTQVTTPVGTLGQAIDSGGYAQNFSYDGFGSLVGVKDSLGNALYEASYQYGLYGFPVSVSDVDGGARSATFDALGEVTSTSDANKHTVSYTYDALSRPKTRVEPDLTTTWTWGNSTSLHNVWQLQNVSAGSYSEAYTYDAVARLSTQQVTSDIAYVETYSYDANTGLLASLTFPTSTSSYRVKIDYGYSNGQLAQISDAGTGTVYWKATAVNPSGQVTNETLGNGVAVARNYDLVRGWLNNTTAGVSGSTSLLNQSYLYDDVGNLIDRQDINAGLGENIFYDSLYRLHSVSSNSKQVQPWILYDAMGRVQLRTDVSTAYWKYDPVHIHAATSIGAATYRYDANGNMVNRNGSSILWTSYDLPMEMSGSGESVQFSYNQDRQRYLQIYTSGGSVEKTYYVAGNLEKVDLASGVQDWRHYIYAGSQPVAIVSRESNGTNAVHYVLQDHLGSTAALLNSTGGTTVKESFTPFGDGRDPTTWLVPESTTNQALIASVTREGFGFHTTLGSPQLGLIHMEGRVYDALDGQFISPDPTVPDPTDPQSFHRYSYTRNNPLTRTDPTGFDDSGDNGDSGEETGPADMGNVGAAPVGPSVGPDTAANQALAAAVDQLEAAGPLAPGTYYEYAQCEGTCGFVVGSTYSDSQGAFTVTESGPLEVTVEGKLWTTRDLGNPATIGGAGVVSRGSRQVFAPSMNLPLGRQSSLGQRIGSFFFNHLMYPAFGWIDCAGGRCSALEEAQLFTGPIQFALPIKVGMAAKVGMATTGVGFAARGAKGLTYLYQKVGAAGEHLKFGITRNPATRYTQAELAGGRLRIIAKGSREQMLKLERGLHETLPIGPEEGQSIYIQKQVERGLTPPPYQP